jgi:hypothetical protein
MSPEELFWDLVEPFYADPAVTRSTMMGLPCVRHDGRFFASLDRRSGALLVKLSAVFNGLRLATALAKRDGVEMRVFLMGDAGSGGDGQPEAARRLLPP